jgi:large subunit ribosomal protein L1
MAEAKKTATAKKATAKKATKEAELVVETALEETKEQTNGNVQEPSETSSDQEAEGKEVADKSTAKAGKRSAKAVKEAEEKEAKEERKAHRTEAEAEEAAKPKRPVKPTRSRLERRGKNFRKSAELVEANKSYSLAEALDLAVKTSPVKFDATVEVHVNLAVDPRHADQNIRDNLVLPAGTGKAVRVAVFADADDVKAAKDAGADIAGIEDITKLLEKGTFNFDTLIATPSQMAKLGKFARVLGPRGLMPNPKSGTVTTDVTKAVAEAKAGRVEYRVDSTGIVHLGIGKVSFGAAKLNENAAAVFASIRGNKPSSVKGNYVKAVHVTTTMGPSISVATSEI